MLLGWDFTKSNPYFLYYRTLYEFFFIRLYQHFALLYFLLSLTDLQTFCKSECTKAVPSLPPALSFSNPVCSVSKKKKEVLWHHQIVVCIESFCLQHLFLPTPFFLLRGPDSLLLSLSAHNKT